MESSEFLFYHLSRNLVVFIQVYRLGEFRGMYLLSYTPVSNSNVGHNRDGQFNSEVPHNLGTLHDLLNPSQTLESYVLPDNPDHGVVDGSCQLDQIVPEVVIHLHHGHEHKLGPEPLDGTVDGVALGFRCQPPIRAVDLGQMTNSAGEGS